MVEPAVGWRRVVGPPAGWQWKIASVADCCLSGATAARDRLGSATTSRLVKQTVLLKVRFLYVIGCVYYAHSHGNDQDRLRRPRSEVGVRSVAAGVVTVHVLMPAETGHITTAISELMQLVLLYSHYETLNVQHYNLKLQNLPDYTLNLNKSLSMI